MRAVRRTALGLLAGVTVLVGGVALLPADHARCTAWRQRPITYTDVTPVELRLLRQRTPVHDAPAFLTPSVLDARVGGLALPGRVIVAGHLSHPDRRNDRENLIWHELVHVEQIRQDGLPVFAARYVSDWVRGRLSGCTTYGAYTAIAYEREADLYAASMEVVEWVRLGSIEPPAARDEAGTGSIETRPLSRIARRLVAAGLG